MKKTLAILLIAILAVSSAFAGISGSVNTTFGYNIDNGDWGFTNNNEGIEAEVVLETVGGEEAVKEGQGDVYAAIKATLSLEGKNTIASPSASPADIDITASLKLDYAKIVGEDWEVSITGALGGPDFAASYDWDDDGDPDYSVKSPATAAPGISAKFLNGYEASLGLSGNAKTKAYDWSASLSTPEYNMDGVLVKAALAASDDGHSASVSVGYTNDDFTLKVATDLAYATDFGTDVALSLDYDFVDLYVYYATNANSIKNNLEARADLAFEPITLTVYGKDLINKQTLGASTEYEVIEGLILAGSAEVTFQNSPENLKVTASTAYTFEDICTLKAATTLAVDVTTPNWDFSLSTAELDVTATNDTLIDGAVLSLGWTGADFMKDDFGKIEAGCKIAF